MADYVIGSGNVFKDLGFANAEEKLAKAKLAAYVNQLIEEKGLTAEEACKILRISAKNMSALKSGRLRAFSIEQLFYFLAALDQHIEITITDRSRVKANRRLQLAYA